MPAGSFIIGNSTAFTFTVSSGASGTDITCETSSSVASQTDLSVNNTNFPQDPSSGERWVKLNTMSITKASGTASFRVFSGAKANSTTSGGVLPVSSRHSYFTASQDLLYGAVFTSSGSLSLYRTSFSGGTVSTNVSATTLPGNLRATITYHTLPYAPGTPVASVSGDEVTVTWSSPSDNGGSSVVGYRLQVSTNGGSFVTLDADTTENTTVRSYSFTGDPGDSYRFRVAALTTMVKNLRSAESEPDATGLYSGTSNSVTVTGATLTVPNVLTQTEDTARDLIENAGFLPVKGANQTSGATAGNNGTVAAQSPSGGTTAAAGSNIVYNLYQFVGPTVSVPDTVGDTQTQATLEIELSGLVASVTFTDVGATSENNRTVKSQSPAAGTTVNPGSTVAIEVYDFGLNLGRRMTGSDASTAISIGRRWDGSSWVNLTVAKRWNGTSWVDFTN